MRRLSQILAGLTVCVLASISHQALAHGPQKKFIDVEVLPGNRVAVTVAVDRHSVEKAMLPWKHTELPDGMLEALRDDYLTGSLGLRTPGGACKSEGYSKISEHTRDDRPFVTAERVYACDDQRPIHLTDDSVHDATHGVMVSVKEQGRSSTQFLSDGVVGMDLVTPSWLAVAGEFLWAGSMHLATGYDHILFLLSLLLGIVALPENRDLHKAFRMAAIVITSFTIGHSLTLISAALGLIPFSSGVVESLIAASIVYVALTNVLMPRQVTMHRWLGLGFGLVHGLGFSSALAETGLPAQGRVLALLSFNVGIEVAQLVVAAIAMIPILWILRHPRGQKLAVVGGSLAIAGVAMIWLVQRVIGVAAAMH